MKALRHHQASTAIVLTIAGFAFALFPSQAMAKRGKKAAASSEVVGQCVSNYKAGLEHEQSGKLLQARELFIRCAKAACGSPLREECTTRFTQLSTDIPSVVPMVTDENGPRTDVEVKVDGEKLTSTLDGHSLILDPGVREFSFSKDGRVFATQKLMIVQGQRNRLISASVQQGSSSGETRRSVKQPKKVAPPPAAVVAANDSDSGEKAEAAPAVELAPRKVTPREPAAREGAPDVNLTAEESASSGHSTLSYVLGGAGLAVVGAGAALIYWGRKDNSRLPECSTATTNCSQGTIDHIHNLYLAGNIALGVGVASLGAAYWVYTHSGKESSKEEAYRFDVQPTKAGAVASVSGSF